MKHDLITRLKQKLLPDVQFSKGFINYLTMNACFSAGTAFSNMFVNIFLLRSQEDMHAVLVYNLLQYAMIPLGFYAAGRLGKKTGLNRQLRIGIILMNILYISLIILRENAAVYALPLGLIFGFSSGLYYMPNNILLMRVTDQSNLDTGLSISSFIGNAIGIVVPLVSGFIVSRFIDITGYIIIFSISLGLFITAGLVNLRAPSDKEEGKFQMISTIKLCMQDKKIVLLNIADFLRGNREGAMGFLLSVLLYQAVKNEFLLGINSFTCATASLLAFAYISKKVNSQNRTNVFVLACLPVLMASFVLFWGLNAYTIFVFSIITAIANLMMNNASTAVGYTYIYQNNTLGTRRTECVVYREFFINMGRSASIAALFFISQTPVNTVLFIFTLYFLQIPAWFFLRKVKPE